MNTETDFLSAVLADPELDGPRLVLADWWDEQGQPARAEFIRVQCELARLGVPPKHYDRVDSFTFVRGSGSAGVKGEPVAVGDRIDLVLPKDERRRFSDLTGQRLKPFKREWHGLLVTEIMSHSATYDGRTRTGVEFVMDEGSGEWPGHALQRRERELLRKGWHDWMPTLDRYPLACGNRDAFPKSGYSSGNHHITLTYRRGLVGAVTCTAAQFVGGRCGRCAEVEHNYPIEKQAAVFTSCPDCRGTGRTSGIAPDLFAAAPITSVTLSDREPVESVTGWWWSSPKSAGNYPQSVLPEKLFRKLLGVGPTTILSPSYYAPALALAALDRAACRWGRSVAAGLTHPCPRCVERCGWDYCQDSRSGVEVCRTCKGERRLPGLPPSPEPKEESCTQLA